MPAVNLNLLDWVSLGWFALCWLGYTRFSGFRSRRTRRIQDALHTHIKQWIEVLHRREFRSRTLKALLAGLD